MNYFLAIIVVAAAAWWLTRSSTKSSESGNNLSKMELMTNEEVVEIQRRFEHKLEAECDLPDGIRGMEAYIYWNLMRPWFDRLSAAHRYDEKVSRQIQRDWVEYMHLLPSLKTSRYLALESSNESKSSAYEEDAVKNLRAIKAIQDAFAAQIGSEATALIHNIRNRNFDAFDRTGKLPVAPEDHHYFPVSLNPYVEACRPKNILPSA